MPVLKMQAKMIQFPIVLTDDFPSLRRIQSLSVEELANANCKFKYPLPVIPLEYLILRPYSDIVKYLELKGYKARGMDMHHSETYELASRLLNRLEKLPMMPNERKEIIREVLNMHPGSFDVFWDHVSCWTDKTNLTWMQVIAAYIITYVGHVDWDGVHLVHDMVMITQVNILVTYSLDGILSAFMLLMALLVFVLVIALLYDNVNWKFKVTYALMIAVAIFSVWNGDIGLAFLVIICSLIGLGIILSSMNIEETARAYLKSGTNPKCRECMMMFARIPEIYQAAVHVPEIPNSRWEVCTWSDYTSRIETYHPLKIPLKSVKPRITSILMP